ncbi:MAG: BatD family protein [Bacteroidales bacterium]|nr:BatD family protein [Bacteroidales bacterium]
MVRIKTRLIFILLFIISGQASAQQLRATASLDSTQILIGDQVKLTLEIEYPDNIKIEFPQVPDTIQNLIEVLGRSSIDTLEIESEKLQKLTQVVTITSFDSGSYQIPPFWFTFNMNGLIDSIPSNSVALHVFSIEVDTTMGPTDIKMPYGAPVILKEVIPHILGIILIGAILFLVLYSIKRRKNIITQKPQEPAHIIALLELERIKNEKLWQKDKIKQYYSEITEVLRNYMGNRFQIPAMEQTTDEILQIFINRDNLLNEKSLSNLKQILSLSDLVKFAKYKPSADDDNMTLINSFFFVNDTKLEKVKKVKEDDNCTDNDE